MQHRNEDLREMFSEFGEVADCYIPRDHATGQSRGFGFIRYREGAASLVPFGPYGVPTDRRLCAHRMQSRRRRRP